MRIVGIGYKDLGRNSKKPICFLVLTALTAAFHAFGGSHNADFASPSFAEDQRMDDQPVSLSIVECLVSEMDMFLRDAKG